MTKTLYLMRHGQTVFNLKGRIQGASDSPLTALGVAQAQSAKEYFEKHHITFDTLVSSSQERACETLENAVPNQNYKRLKGIKEWGFGLFEGESIELLKTIKEPENLYGDHVVPFGGESKSEVESRVFETLEDVIVNQTNQTALAVSHGSTIGLFIRKVLGKREGSTYDIGNCHILKFEYDGNHFRFIEIINPSV
ncbi:MULTISPECIES: histidine phosphatase family protein [Staphylococcus]|uniref:histidine phosphatase family protein n=1 Tax=Staphylococcus TaxID=1279 RepID=UPI0001EF4ADE|nr:MULTISPECIES: histidine phosphatase family protein [Staphylococcus]EFS17018.1 phosphoglycerate mutase family protein [Staphylococcus capitis C87]MBC3048208.1 histidine phosphatase family protein [Staphylococcus capitis]MBC3069005.1 histidine phosphatase family protein [Staphylococcus capitis]MBC3071191.1 histidine phosphatase family protein [Staphylococcus capitis]MBC3081302.1 histidine phosphatase family protein [Staphylococcus capitis]